MDRKTLQAIFKTIRDQFKQSDRYKSVLAGQISVSKGPKGGKLYSCQKCLKHFKPTEIELNHEPPVCEIGRKWFTYSIHEYYERVFTLPLEVCCKPCHKSITKSQNSLRRLKAKNPI